MDALKAYQNRDGGFGLGLEPDFHLPASSPMATSVAFQILQEIPESEEKHQMIQAALNYLRITYHPPRRGWLAVTAQINEFPHAPWWQWNLETGGTPIDAHWGNPTVELIGYCWVYRPLLPQWAVREMVRYSIDQLNIMSNFSSEHEIYCYIRLYNLLPQEFRTQMRKKLTEAIQSLVILDSSQWKEYVPTPLHFITHPEQERFDIPESALQANLGYIIEKLNRTGVIEPNWEWGEYPEIWLRAKTIWTGVLTLRNLVILRNFGVIN